MENLKPPGPMIFSGNISENWKRWKQAFKIYGKATGMEKKDDEIQVAIFLHVIGEEALEKYNTFELTEGDDLENIIEAFDEYCIPRSNECIERHIFFSRSQIEGESFDSFLTDLKKLCINCGFEQLKESLIRDRIIGGIINKNLRDRLLREGNLTLDHCIKICKTSELAEQQSRMLEKENVVHEISKPKVVYGRKLNQKGHVQQELNNSKQKNKYKKDMVKSFKSNSNRKFICTRCGKTHGINECPAYGKVCSSCKRNNHFAKMCKSKYVQSINNESNNDLYDTENEYAEGETFYISAINDGAEEDEWFEELKIKNNQKLRVKLDTGAQCNVLTWEKFQQLNQGDLAIQKSSNKLSNYDGKRINCIGKCTIMCETRNGERKNIEFQVVKTKMNVPSLLGLKMLKILKLVQRVDSISKTLVHVNTNQIIDEYKELFEGIGKIKDCEYKIKLKKNAVGKIEACRKVPLRLIQPLREQLNYMENEGIIRKVNEPTEWVNSLVIVKKKDKLRICLDPQHLNDNILREHYQLPTLEEITGRLSNAKKFSVLDAHKGFWQIKLHQESEKFTTFNTPLGRYCYRRLPYGLNSAPEVFHKTYREIFGDSEGIEVYIDDLLVWGKNEEEHDRRLKQVLKRAKEFNIKFNKNKCKFGVNQVKYLGHLFTNEGLKPDIDRIKAISEMKSPENKKELEKMLGVVTYVAKFIPNLSQRTVKLRELLKKNISWKWEQVHEDSFNQIKKILTQEPVLQMFKENDPVTLSVDASQDGLGAVLLQNRLPVAYASKSLTDTQRQYAQIEKETLAILFGCERFHQYLYGKSFVVESDHKPLEVIFKKSLNKCPVRLQRMLIRMQPYEFTVKYKPGREMYIADTLSRTNGTDQETKIDIDTETHVAIITDHLPMTKIKIKSFQDETAKDEELQILKKFINGLVEETPEIKEKIGHYIKFQEEIYEANGLMFKNDCVLVPKSLRPEMLTKIHYNHLGVEKCKSRAREVLYWPHMSKEIEDLVLNCDVCHRFQNKNCKENLIPKEIPDGPWEVLGSDLFYYEGKDFLLVVDYYSKYVEIEQLQDLSAEFTIKTLKNIFARHGVPELIYTDNGPQFQNKKFKQFEKDWGFKHITSSPGYAQSNGMAERYIQTVKKMWKKAKLDGKDPYLTMLEYRNTPITKEIKSPNNLLYGRKVKGLLPNKKYMIPRRENEVTCNLFKLRQDKQKSYFDRHTKQLKPLKPNENVFVTKTGLQGKPLMMAKVLTPADRPRSYRILTEQGRVIERNRKDLMKGSPKRTFQTINEKDSSYPNIDHEERNNTMEENKEEITELRQLEPKKTRTGREVKTPGYLKDYIRY